MGHRSPRHDRAPACRPAATPSALAAVLSPDLGGTAFAIRHPAWRADAWPARDRQSARAPAAVFQCAAHAGTARAAGRHAGDDRVRLSQPCTAGLDRRTERLVLRAVLG